MKNLVLYHMDSCMFCVKVRNFMAEHKIDIPLKDVGEDNAAREELIAIGGKPQVPCLVIDGDALYESFDIVQWLQKNMVDA